jgi:hypothetical protein
MKDGTPAQESGSLVVRSVWPDLSGTPPAGGGETRGKIRATVHGRFVARARLATPIRWAATLESTRRPCLTTLVNPFSKEEVCSSHPPRSARLPSSQRSPPQPQYRCPSGSERQRPEPHPNEPDPQARRKEHSSRSRGCPGSALTGTHESARCSVCAWGSIRSLELAWVDTGCRNRSGAAEWVWCIARLTFTSVARLR